MWEGPTGDKFGSLAIGSILDPPKEAEEGKRKKKRERPHP